MKEPRPPYYMRQFYLTFLRVKLYVVAFEFENHNISQW